MAYPKERCSRVGEELLAIPEARPTYPHSSRAIQSTIITLSIFPIGNGHCGSLPNYARTTYIPASSGRLLQQVGEKERILGGKPSTQASKCSQTNWETGFRFGSIVRWRAPSPSPSWFKLNTDGSSLGNLGLAGAAGIIRDSAGYVHLAYQFALGTGTSVLAELTAAWWGMELALTHVLAPLVVEVDATTVISLLKSRASGKWEVQHLIMRIVCLQQLLVADVQHVFREANGAADHLAKGAASLQLTRVLHHDDITGVLRGILCLDRQGVPHLRRG
ncbi:UNVERIFIED_CONTAM: putative ribonuclease H protein [Sesamum calycinum]|uniref:Ribonuclease H protein n=1 Tax=Sesamum calycinum TaxID=2727403 RepID=A0AAW2JB98_9LAMI